MKTEFKFFQDSGEEMNRPPHDNTHPACGTPNAPWWCEEEVSPVSIAMYPIILIIAAVVLIILKLKLQNTNK